MAEQIRARLEEFLVKYNKDYGFIDDMVTEDFALFVPNQEPIWGQPGTDSYIEDSLNPS